jgi:hypothetical protein
MRCFVRVLFPAAVIAIELATKLCAQSLFDPMPTYGHVAAVAFVPACNFLIWTALDRERGWGVRWLAFANGAAIAIATLYALLFLPLLPIAIIAVVVGIGFLPLAPLTAFLSALSLRRALARRQRDRSLTLPLVSGLPGRSSPSWSRSMCHRPPHASASRWPRAARLWSASAGSPCCARSATTICCYAFAMGWPDDRLACSARS